jgi:hypothetical protein
MKAMLVNDVIRTWNSHSVPSERARRGRITKDTGYAISFGCKLPVDKRSVNRLSDKLLAWF